MQTNRYPQKKRLARSPDSCRPDGGYRHTTPSIGFVSTYPPTECGIATFTSALRTAIADERCSADRLKVVSLVDARRDDAAPEVMFQHVTGDPRSLELAGKALNDMDIAVVQHEYGIYGGADGAEVLDLVTSLKVPSVVVLHTVPANPTPNQRRILEALVRESTRSIVLSQSALSQLLFRYDVAREKVTVVPHGANSDFVPRSLTVERPQLLTWGLIGPGKGLETALEAVAELGDLRPQPRYLIQGGTHPKVREGAGNSYFQGLVDRAHSLELDGVVQFDNRYVDLASLNTTIRRADIVVLPYDSTEQVASGVLVEAIAAGKPVVATEFPHAVEMLSTGAGIVVPHRDSAAMATALRRLLTRPDEMAAMGQVAKSLGATLDWANVATSYEDVVQSLTLEQEARAGLERSLTRGPAPADLTSAGRDL
ncbi:glycosyltransferase [soil metagenome]